MISRLKPTRALFVGDTHLPWCDEARLNTILDAIVKLQPDIVAQMGDLYDFYSFSRHPKSLNIMTPKQELVEGRAQAEAFWSAVAVMAPGARRIQLLGNHDTRIERMVMSKAPELEAVLEALDFKQLWRFEGVETQADYTSEIVIDGLDNGNPVMLLHGYRSKLGDHARFNQMSTVVGHTHRAGVVPIKLHDRIIHELNCGYVADQHSRVMNYRDQRLSDSTPAYGIWDELGPRYVTL